MKNLFGVAYIRFIERYLRATGQQIKSRRCTGMWLVESRHSQNVK